MRRRSPVFLLAVGGFCARGVVGLSNSIHRISGDFTGRQFLAVGERHIEFELEVDGGIVETTDRIEWDDQLFRNVREGKADLEMRFSDLHIPELVLDDDGHLLGVFRLQVLGDPHAGRAGEEGDEEVMITGQAARSCDFRQNLADDAAKCILCQNVVADMILPHAFPVFRRFGVFSQGCMPRPGALGKTGAESRF